MASYEKSHQGGDPPMRLDADNHEYPVQLSHAETKLLLALSLRAKHGPQGWTHNPSEFENTFTDNTISGLAMALFGENGKFVGEDDIVQLHYEAYAEWRRG